MPCVVDALTIRWTLGRGASRSEDALILTVRFTRLDRCLSRAWDRQETA